MPINPEYYELSDRAAELVHQGRKLIAEHDEKPPQSLPSIADELIEINKKQKAILANYLRSLGHLPPASASSTTNLRPLAAAGRW